MVSIANVHRIVAIVSIRAIAYGTTSGWKDSRAEMLFSLELHLGILAACLPFIGPPLARMGGGPLNWRKPTMRADGGAVVVSR